MMLFSFAMVMLITAGKSDDETILKSSGGHISSTGAPGERTCAQAGCHSDAQIDMDDKVVTTLTLGIGDNAYTPAKQYGVTIRAVKVGTGRFGFQVVALDSNNSTVGTFAVPQGSNKVQTQKGSVNAENRNYVTHTTAGNKPVIPGEIEWRFNWTAPKSYQGKVTFYYCVNVTNMNNASSGDHLYFASYPFNAVTTDVTENVPTIADISVYPTVATDYLTLENKSGFGSNTSYEVVSIGGLTLQKNRIENSGNVAVIPLASLANGMYSLVINSDGRRIVKQFVVVR